MGVDNHGDAYDLDSGNVDRGSGDNMDWDDDSNDNDYVHHGHDDADDCSNLQLLLAARNLLSMTFEKSNNDYDYLLADKDLNKEERRIK